MKNGQRLLITALVAVVLVVALVLPYSGRQSAMAGSGGIIYVDSDATGLNSGASWKHAFNDLQDALNEAEPLDQIWVAAGIYKPSHEFIPGDPRSASFQMVNGVAIYGGFAPGAGVTKFEDRDWVAHETVLSGDLGTAGDPSDNSYHVWYHPEDLELDSSAVLDGFIITGGNADLVGYPHGLCGGGVLSVGLSPNWRNITFLNNSAVYGGAMWVGAPFPEEVTVILTNVAFVSNSAVEGGSVYISAELPALAGGIIFTNCIFWSNVAERGGGVAITWGEEDADTPPIRFTNCTFNSNQAASGGGAYVSEESKGLGWFMVTNSILFGDTGDEIYVEDGASPPIVTYSDVEGGYEGAYNIDEEPGFVDPDAGDLHLQPYSLCIDEGDNDATGLPDYDFEGDERVLEGDGDGWPVVDMGADEYSIPTLQVEIDVTPDIVNNVIRVRPWVMVDVAILSADEFDATTVESDTVLFAGAPARVVEVEDVDGDGVDDLLVYFYATEMVDLDEDSTEATLTGQTEGGVLIEGTDDVKVR